MFLFNYAEHGFLFILPFGFNFTFFYFFYCILKRFIALKSFQFRICKDYFKIKLLMQIHFQVSLNIFHAPAH